ncbi:YybH family protein [Nocardia donostiensis]|nr:DUF4440 domain-containing protein [Nocardia donostiensis]
MQNIHDAQPNSGTASFSASTSGVTSMSGADIHSALATHIERWVDLFNNADTAALNELYEPEAVLVPAPGTPMTGPNRAAALDHLRSFGVPLRARLRHAYQAGDIALLIVDWSISGTSPDGHTIDLTGTATDIVRRQADGSWRYVIDNPAGTT